MSNGRRNLVCPFKSCQFEGIKLKRHLTGRIHNLDEKDALVREAYLAHKVKYICTNIKHHLTVPTICAICRTCVDRIDQHLNHVHQIGRGTWEMRKKIKNSKSFTRKFEINFSKIDPQSEQEVNQEDESEENQSDKEEKVSKIEKKI